MLTLPSLSGQRFLVYGLARTGLSAVRFLLRSRAAVLAWDEVAAARAAVAALPGVALADPLETPLSGLSAIVCSPGVPLNRHPLAARARVAGVPIVGDLELFQWLRPTLPPHRLAAITGTNGKSTTTALLHHLLVAAGRPADLGGNIGQPVLDQPPLAEGGTYVFELSSFQIDLCQTLAADLAIFTNLTPDHLDRYDGIEGYFAAKLRLFRMQQPGAAAIVAVDDSYTVRAAAGVAAADFAPGLVLHRVTAASIDGSRQQHWPALQGPHNAENAACAIEAARILGLDDEAIEAGLQSFPGLPHRMQRVRLWRGVAFIDDSKATNPSSVAPALAAFPAIHWILGGKPKTDDLDPCLPHLGHVRAAYVIGEAAPMYKRLLQPLLPVVEAGTLAAAVAAAATAARPGEAVLLSPACASYDQFPNYEVRGDSFRALAEALPEALPGAPQ